MIEIENLTKKYGKLTAVDNVSLSIADNECFALLGLNGAGKTTLINVLTTQTPATSGTAKIDGHSITTEKIKVREIVNISPQESAVAKSLTVRENLELIASLYNGLGEKENVVCKKLSGGQTRRLSIALAIITEPKVLFLDEPTLALDVKARKNLWDIVERLKKRMTIILTTHYLEEAEQLADRVGIISRGKIRAVGSVADILSQTGYDSLEQAFIALTEED